MEFSPKMHIGVMKQLEASGIVKTITENFQELHLGIPEGVTHVKIVSLRGRESIYAPYQAEGGLEGYRYIGRAEKP